MSDVKKRPIADSVNNDDWLVVQRDDAGFGEEVRVKKSTLSGYEHPALNPVQVARMADIRKRLYAAKNGGTYNYIVSGDSTRSYPVVHNAYVHEDYYNYLLKKISSTITVSMNAESGQRAELWRTNVGTATLAACTALISGTGANSIVEFSFGINDLKYGRTYAEVKTSIQGCIDALLAAKADVKIVLVTPVKTGLDVRNIGLRQIYLELSDENNLPLIDGYLATKDVHGTDYYSDATHPGFLGAHRLINYIINTLVPESIIADVTFDDASLTVTPVVRVGKYWSTDSGVDTASAAWISLEPISVPRGAMKMTITHSGTRKDVICMDSGGSYIERLLIDTTIAPNRIMYLPWNCAEIRINIDSASNVSSVDDLSISFQTETMSEINSGLFMRTPLTI